jgi:enoyl-CoA hydratase
VAEKDRTVRCERHDSIAVVTLDRPERHNALNAGVLDELEATFGALTGDGTTRAVVLTGAGPKAFSAGADLDELTGLDGAAAHRKLSRGQGVLRRIETCGLPVVAAVNGLALGGGFELALAGTVLLASTNATFGLPESGLGLMPGYGGTQRLSRAIGRHAALHLMLSGQRIDARRAYELGLVVEPPVPPEELAGAAKGLAERIARSSPRSVRTIIAAVDQGADTSLAAGLDLESALAGLLTSGPDGAEGIAAFKAKRAPVFPQAGGHR